MDRIFGLLCYIRPTRYPTFRVSTAGYPVSGIIFVNVPYIRTDIMHDQMYGIQPDI